MERDSVFPGYVVWAFEEPTALVFGPVQRPRPLPGGLALSFLRLPFSGWPSVAVHAVLGLGLGVVPARSIGDRRGESGAETGYSTREFE